MRPKLNILRKKRKGKEHKNANTIEDLSIEDDSSFPWFGNDDDLEYPIVEDDDIESDFLENTEALAIPNSKKKLNKNHITDVLLKNKSNETHANTPNNKERSGRKKKKCW